MRSDFWVKAAVLIVAVDVLLSLPSWALGVVLALALGLKYAADRIRQLEHHPEPPPSATAEHSDPAHPETTTTISSNAWPGSSSDPAHEPNPPIGAKEYEPPGVSRRL
jgi:hypothetical protein